MFPGYFSFPGLLLGGGPSTASDTSTASGPRIGPARWKNTLSWMSGFPSPNSPVLTPA